MYGLGLGNKTVVSVREKLTLGVNSHIGSSTLGANSIVGYDHLGVCYDVIIHRCK